MLSILLISSKYEYRIGRDRVRCSSMSWQDSEGVSTWEDK